ncbi:MAG TPA: TolC family protein, partial [Gemmataceae bacterium]|nr:TolC family protein [Gemmataceae bacterium]
MAQARSPAWRRVIAAWAATLSIGIAASPASEAGLNPAPPADLAQAGAYGSAAAATQPGAGAAPATAQRQAAVLSFVDGDDSHSMPINLPTALRLANAGNPTIAVAQARVQEAYARLREAKVLWVPSLLGGPAYMRHDGLIQNSIGNVFNANKQSFFIGGQLALAVDTSEALFAPLVARQLLQAQTASARAVNDNVQLDVALTYLDLLRAAAALVVNSEVLAKAEEMYRRAESAYGAGLGRYTSDPNRAKTEVDLLRQERIDLEGEVAAISARLAQLLLLEPTVDLQPTDPAVLPIALVPDEASLDQLVSTGLMNRPELAESRFLVGAAMARWRQARLAPLVPQLQVSYAAGDFGAGRYDELNTWGGRGDGMAQATWELHNFGLGDAARAQARRAEVSEANFHVVEVQAAVAAEVTAAAKLARARRRALAAAQDGVEQAETMWRRLEKAQFGIVAQRIGRMEILEPLLAVQALRQARLQYLTEVIEYNKAQFRLYWAMGQPPMCSLPQATAMPVEVPVI